MDAINPRPEPIQDEKPKLYMARGVVGSGKTEDLIKTFGESQHERKSEDKKHRQIAGSVPRHDLAEALAKRWEAATDLVAATIMGRLSKDPRRAKPGKEIDPNWCRFPDLVETAIENGHSVQETCCSYKNDRGEKIKCAFLDTCGYQQQFKIAREADLVLIQHATLTHQLDELNKPLNMFIDEDFLEALIFEQPDKAQRKKGTGFRFEIDDLLIGKPKYQFGFTSGFDELSSYRIALHYAIRMQADAGEMGGLQKKYFADLDNIFPLSAANCRMATLLEFDLRPNIDDLRPNLKGRALGRVIEKNAKALAIRRNHNFALKIWEPMEKMLDQTDIEVSGHVFLFEDDHNGKVCIGVRGLRFIAQQWLTKNVIVASATMPPLNFIQHAFPNYEIVPDDISYEVPLPEHVKYVPVLNAPIAKHKTEKIDKVRIRDDLRRYAMERALECDTPQVLVGVQEHIEMLWKETQAPMPKGFDVKHFNGVSGLDDYKLVGLMVSIGVTAVPPADVEDQYAAITGRDPKRLPEDEWYPHAKGFIELRDGGIVEVECYAHPDPEVEAWRRHKYLAAIIQMIGRSRLYNRNASTPLTVCVLCNEPLGIKADAVMDWKQDRLKPMALVEPMAVDGFVALAPEAMCKLWPNVFKQETLKRGSKSKAKREITSTAKRELKELRDGSKAAQRVQAILARWHPFKLQKPGKGQKQREGYYDPARFERVEGLRSALEATFGPGLRLEEG